MASYDSRSLDELGIDRLDVGVGCRWRLTVERLEEHPLVLQGDDHMRHPLHHLPYALLLGPVELVLTVVGVCLLRLERDPRFKLRSVRIIQIAGAGEKAAPGWRLNELSKEFFMTHFEHGHCMTQPIQQPTSLQVTTYVLYKPQPKPRRGLLHIRPKKAPPCSSSSNSARSSPPYQAISTMVDRRCRTFTVAATLCLVFFAHGAMARPVASTATIATAPATAMEMPMDVPDAAAASPEGSSATWERGDEALGAGKWLPLPALTGGLRFPGVFPLPAAGGGIASMPWIGGAPPALAVPAGGIPALVPPYVGATRQEQVSVWASLFNPFQVKVPSSTSVQVHSEPGSRVPAVAGAGMERTTAVDQPAGVGAQVGEPKWGVFLGTTTPNING
ncbi:uncharacterized protein LOC124655690 [Lolium rigidum]|uniref:uncharacterized protein LOC124655690 n=1 Tax=Lolium rigidum TaxID=89674 RepID=UPI001F5C7203|nr:uncharacterized protein LOC124655690 [Lolium rigidum]